MARRRLGAHTYAEVAALPSGGGRPACTFAVVRRDADGRRSLLQCWEPRPAERLLDVLRAEFLHRFSQAEPLDPGACHMGFDEDRVWVLQELGGTPLPRLWGEADPEGREDLRAALGAAAGTSRVARLFWPEVVGIRPGRILAPRILGGAAPTHPGLPMAPAGEGAPPGPRPWRAAPDLGDSARLPTRGRAQELTYLKSLMLGLASGLPMERVVILQGEAGLGHPRLCDWAAAAAESEGLWVSDLEALPAEAGGAFLARLVQDLISGLEAELYAEQPAVARALSGCMPTFAFLRGGRRAEGPGGRVEPAALDAAVAALAFAQGRHPRLLVVRGLEHASQEVHDLVKDLVEASRLPWLLALRGTARAGAVRACTASLRNHPEAALVVLGRLPDPELALVLEDLLGAHALAPDRVQAFVTASLGNPGLLRRLLERAQAEGDLVHEGGRWRPSAGAPAAVGVPEDLVQELLAGRLLRLDAAALALVRDLALADRPLSLPVLGLALGLDPDGVAEALASAVNAKLAVVEPSGAAVAGAQVRGLILARMPSSERARCARLLLKVLEADAGRPVLSVPLLSLALEPAEALARVLHALELERPAPEAARRIVTEALALRPDPGQEARLWEALADSLGASMPQGQAASEQALEALDRALQALAPAAEAGQAQAARLHRKRGQLAQRLRRFTAAAAALGEAARLLADHPLHPEQPRLHLALGRLQLAQGEHGPGVRSLERGLALTAGKGPAHGGGERDGDPADAAALLLELGQTRAQGALWQGALEALGSARRLLEHAGDRRGLVAVLGHLGTAYQGMGQTVQAGDALKEAFALAAPLDDPELLAGCHLRLGIFRSCQQHGGAALDHLDRALQGFAALGDRAMAAQAQAWKARTAAALGDPVLAELLFLQASGIPAETLTPLETGDRVLLEGELALFKGAWAEARKHFQAAANRFGQAGLVWRERMARIRSLQAEARGPCAPEALTSAWVRLEALKGPVEASGSRWLDAEWHRAHALVLSRSGPGDAVASDALLAWGQVLAGARDLGMPALLMEANTRCARLLLDRGERLGARSRAQDAAAAFRELWAGVPGTFGPAFLARPEVQACRQAAENAGLPFPVPERADPLADWSPTQVNLPLVPPS